MKIERMGTTVVSIVATAVKGTASVALNPVLPDVIGNYMVFCNITAIGATQIMRAVRGTITAANNLSLETFRGYNLSSGTVNAGSTGVSVAGNDLLGVTQPAGTEHGSDINDLGLGHGHDTQDHPVTDPQHTHPFTGGSLSSNLSAENDTVQWMIIHI